MTFEMQSPLTQGLVRRAQAVEMDVQTTKKTGPGVVDNADNDTRIVQRTLEGAFGWIHSS
jgi:hypothetical protein